MNLKELRAESGINVVELIGFIDKLEMIIDDLPENSLVKKATIAKLESQLECLIIWQKILNVSEE